MPAILQNPHRTWLILVLATATTFWVGVEGGIGLAAGAVTFGITWIKARLVVLDFMELRHAPPLWRRIIEGWLIAVTALLLTAYYLGPMVLPRAA